jgi:hypothetical protein
MLRRNKNIFAASHAAINSASVDESATVGCNLVLYAMGQPAIFAPIPDRERLVFKHAAQSESTKVCGSNGPCFGRVICGEIVPCKATSTVGSGCSGRSITHVCLQK